MRNTTTIITYLCIVIVAFNSAALGAPPSPADSGITVRPGFALTIAIENLERPRFMEVAPDGTLFVSFPHLGQIKSCKDLDRDGSYESLEIFVENHPTVHGLVWHEGWLWFTESGAIFRARDNNDDGRADTEEAVVPAGQLPKGGGHWWRSILIHNQRLYTSIGDSGNINDETATERQKIWSFKLDGTDKQLLCSGIRNTEKLVVRPCTEEICGMDHVSDRYGKLLEDKDKSAGQPITDLNPPCEMNHYIQDGFYGHPFVVGNRLVRYEFMDKPDIVKLAAKTIPPAWATGGHWAPNAMEFYTGSQFPRDYPGDAFVAYHGSWNSSLKVGYCVTRVLFDNGKPYGELKIVDFLARNGSVLGRPVDVANTPDGSILISDDHGGKIYRLSYQSQDEKK